MLRKHWILALLLLPLSSYAEGIGYNYAELNYIADQNFDVGALDDDGDGWNFNASATIDETFFLNGGYSDVTFDDSDIDASNFNLGLGVRNHLSDTLDVFGVFSYEDFEVDLSSIGLGNVDEDGFGFLVGARSLISTGLEFNGQIKYTDIEELDGFGFKLGVLYAFAPNWAGGVDYSSGSLEGNGIDLDIDEVRVGLRYIF